MQQYDAPDLLFDLHLDLWEGPSWDAAAGRLSFVDLPAPPNAGAVFVTSPGVSGPGATPWVSMQH